MLVEIIMLMMCLGSARCSCGSRSHVHGDDNGGHLPRYS